MGRIMKKIMSKAKAARSIFYSNHRFITDIGNSTRFLRFRPQTKCYVTNCSIKTIAGIVFGASSVNCKAIQANGNNADWIMNAKQLGSV